VKRERRIVREKCKERGKRKEGYRREG